MIAADRKASCLLGTVFVMGFGLSLIGCGSKSGSPSGRPATSLGQPVEEDVPHEQAGALTDESLGKTLAVEGEIVKQCPAAGCWFIVKDETGELFVDLNPAKLRLERKRVGQHATVTGRVTKQGGQFRLEARHVQFETGEAAPENRE